MGSKSKRANSGRILQRLWRAKVTRLAQKALGLQSSSSWKVFWGAALLDYSDREILPKASAVGHCFSQDTGMDLL